MIWSLLTNMIINFRFVCWVSAIHFHTLLRYSGKQLHTIEVIWTSSKSAMFSVPKLDKKKTQPLALCALTLWFRSDPARKLSWTQNKHRICHLQDIGFCHVQLYIYESHEATLIVHNPSNSISHAWFHKKVIALTCTANQSSMTDQKSRLSNPTTYNTQNARQDKLTYNQNFV